MKRYGVLYMRHEDQIIATLYTTWWGHIARWLHLPNRYVAKFTEIHPQ